jgi:hypothetical protein
MGFTDAFNETRSWYASTYLAIDQGPIILMIENYRSQLLWDLFMANPEIEPMMDAIGFEYWPASLEKTGIDRGLKVYPNPSVSNLYAEFTLQKQGPVRLEVLDLKGKRLLIPVDGDLMGPGKHRVEVSRDGLEPGMYLLRLITAEGYSGTAKFAVR